MRFMPGFALLCSISLTWALSPSCALAIDEKPSDQQAIAALIQRAALAQPREQCFLYAELVHQMTELAARQLAAGDVDMADVTLNTVQQYADKIHMGIAEDTKRLKNAEILMRHTSFRLKEILYGASPDDRPKLQATLKRLDQVESELMLQVFRH
ncbi:MAG TPA: hypothetical protein VM554_04700 [Acidisarcina sp.]|nr:hypothetical protein [Acidisarcina sp.]